MLSPHEFGGIRVNMMDFEEYPVPIIQLYRISVGYEEILAPTCIASNPTLNQILYKI